MTDQAICDAAEGAVETLTRCIAVRLPAHGVRVNCIAPGAPSFWPKDLEDTPQNRARLSLIPHGRFGTPEDFARLVLFLCSPESDYLVGQVIALDGGRGTYLPVEEIEERERARRTTEDRS